ncbi:hypothetical protein [Bacteroides graminisolvens]|uniref:hypothetical protein n=1 Tax=Bacteroides graminisolvens TaxID=477666 RepID=UPI0029C6608C|nr:hypothetical protein [Bacteroides graminisolvens]
MPDWLQLLLFFVISVLTQLIVSYFTQKGKGLANKQDGRDISYETEKGKNLATKEDLSEITKQIESVKNEISFENQRKHAYIEQRTERFIKILHLIEELLFYRNFLFFYLYDSSSVEKLSNLIKDANNTLLELIHESRMVIVSTKSDKEVMDIMGALISSSHEYTISLCTIASNAISHLSEWKIYFDLYTQGNQEALTNMGKSRAGLEEVRNEFYINIDKKQKILQDSTDHYLVVLKRLFNKEFYLKFEFTGSQNRANRTE